jgi:endonuclease/exonuclease/phosphatase (EEP) superfamily protein YafD
MPVIALVATVLAGVSLAAFLGGLWWPLDLVSNFRPQMAVVLGVLGLTLVGSRWKRASRFVLAVALINALLVGTLWLPAPAPPEGDRVRVLSFNLLAANDRYDAVVGYIGRSAPDVVFLHEASRPWEEAMAAADLGYEVVKTRDDDHIFGTLVMVKGDATVEGFGYTIREPRSVEVIYTTESGTAVGLLGIHPLAPDTAEFASLRDAQIRFAANWAKDREGEPTVVVGDFNAGPWSHAFRDLLSTGRLVDSEKGFGLQPSFPATVNIVLRVPIDHLLASPDIGVLDRRLGPRLGSDHFPLLVDLVVPPAGG